MAFSSDPYWIFDVNLTDNGGSAFNAALELAIRDAQGSFDDGKIVWHEPPRFRVTNEQSGYATNEEEFLAFLNAQGLSSFERIEPDETVQVDNPPRHFIIFDSSGNVPAIVLNVQSEGEAIKYFLRELRQARRLLPAIGEIHAREIQQPEDCCILLEPRRVDPIVPAELRPNDRIDVINTNRIA